MRVSFPRTLAAKVCFVAHSTVGLLVGRQPRIAANQNEFASGSRRTQVGFHGFPIMHRQSPDDFRNAAALTGSSQRKGLLDRRCLRHVVSLRQAGSRNECLLSTNYRHKLICYAPVTSGHFRHASSPAQTASRLARIRRRSRDHRARQAQRAQALNIFPRRDPGDPVLNRGVCLTFVPANS